MESDFISRAKGTGCEPMSGVWIWVAALSIGVAAWREVRRFGVELDDQEVTEAAPVIGGLLVGLAYACAALVTGPGDVILQTEPFVVTVFEDVVKLTAGVMIVLIGLEGALWDLDYIGNEWLLFPEQLRPEAAGEPAHSRGQLDGDYWAILVAIVVSLSVGVAVLGTVLAGTVVGT